MQQNVVPEAQLGDVILYDYGSGTTLADGSVDHAMIITGFSGQYPLVSGHSYDVIKWAGRTLNPKIDGLRK